MPTLTGANFIGARESREGAAGAFRARDPTSGATLDPEFAEATAAEVDAAAWAAGLAFEACAGVSPTRRAAFLRAIADQLEAFFDEVGGDGFMLSPIYCPGAIEEFVDLVVPELQRRGRYRTSYSGVTQRDHLRQKV